MGATVAGPVTEVIVSAVTREQALAFALRREVSGEVRFDPGSRHLYATDASNYRHVPAGVVLPRTEEDVATTMRLCRQHGVSVTSRGGGTSLAGQAANTGVVVDCSRHLDRILDIDGDRRTARVQPGVVLSDLQRAAAPHGLRFGPDPATRNRATFGGMIGNNACGPHSLTTGRTADNVVSLRVLLADGVELTVGRHSIEQAHTLAAAPGRVGELHGGLLELRERYGALARARFPDIPRRVSGINLDELAHPDAIDVARALVGTEGTCAIVLEATVQLVPAARHTALLVIGYPSLVEAADDVEAARATGPTALEGISDQVVAGARGTRAAAKIDLLPPGGGWTLATYGDDTSEGAAAAAQQAAAELGHDASVVVTEPEVQRQIWEVRGAGLGAVAFVPGQPAKWPGWEDAGVPPARMGAYLRGLITLLDDHGLEAAVYGHLGDGCLHSKISFDHTTDQGIAQFRRFVEAAADLAVAHGGCPSGEHGDGQARAELYERTFGRELVDGFGAFKRLWDPDNLLNPGRLVDPRPLDADLRLGARREIAATDAFFTYDRGDFLDAATRCIGVGLCRRDDGAGTMCPSYQATREEAHSTRGRAHLLFEMLQPDSELDGWRDTHVHDALELCLSCKGCKVDCPATVDLATYKAEFNAHHFAGRLRPRTHYALGLVRWWLRAGSHTPTLGNAVLESPAGAWLRRLAGVTTRRAAPRLATQTLRAWLRGRASRGDGAPVVLFPDTFTDHLDPRVGQAAVRVLEAAGFQPRLPTRPVCCGRPLFDPGMLRLAKRTLRRLLDVLAPAADAGLPIVVLEPSCAAALRDELPSLLADDPRAATVAAATRTLAELLTAAGWTPPQLAGTALVHGHCHQKAVMGLQADGALLDATGLDWREPDAGCCGLAGSFGFEEGRKYEVSVAAGERTLGPAVRGLPEGTQVVADGFSCRTQIRHLAPDSTPRHLAEVLAAGLDGA